MRSTSMLFVLLFMYVWHVFTLVNYFSIVFCNSYIYMLKQKSLLIHLVIFLTDSRSNLSHVGIQSSTTCTSYSEEFVSRNWHIKWNQKQCNCAFVIIHSILKVPWYVLYHKCIAAPLMFIFYAILPPIYKYVLWKIGDPVNFTEGQ